MLFFSKSTFTIYPYNSLLIVIVQNILLCNTQFHHGFYHYYNPGSMPNGHYTQGYTPSFLYPNSHRGYHGWPNTAQFKFSQMPSYSQNLPNNNPMPSSSQNLPNNNPNDLTLTDSVGIENNDINDRATTDDGPLPWSICGLSADALNIRIIGGRRANPGDYPWIVRLGYTTSNSSNIIYRCGGSLINANNVITAAHCVTNLPNLLRLVRVRLADAAQFENLATAEDVAINQFFIHPRYNSPRLRNDIAVIRLDRNVQFNSYIRPICLPNSETSNNRSGQQATVVGWESFLNNNDNLRSQSSSELQKADLIIEDFNECQRNMARNAAISIGPGQICASGSRSGRTNQDSCDGDSGGPLQRTEIAEEGPLQGEIRSFLIGLVSFGPRRCGTQRISAVYTNVAEYIPWILSLI